MSNEYKYETTDAYDLDWTEEIIDRLTDKFDDEDIIDKYDIEYERENGYNSPSYKVYYLEFETKDYDGYKLQLDEEYSHWILSHNGEEIDTCWSGLESDDYDENGDPIYRVNENIQELCDWIIENVKKYEQQDKITDKANDLIDNLNDDDDLTYGDKVKLVKYLIKKLDISIEDLE